MAHRPNRKDMEEVNRLIEEGTVRPIDGRSYPLDQAGDALLHFGEGRSLGKVVFTAEGDRH